MKETGLFLFLILIQLIGWNVIAHHRGYAAVSEVMEWLMQLNPVFPFLLGMVAAHWAWPIVPK